MKLLTHASITVLAFTSASCRLQSEAPSGGGEMQDSERRDDDREDPFSAERERMVSLQVAARGVRDARVLDALRAVPRHLFVPEAVRPYAYEDNPLPIGEGQTISQPYIVAVMTEMLKVQPGARVLEVGTGSGYQAAVLAAMGVEVFTIEIVEPLGIQARTRLAELGHERVHVRIGDGYRGWPEEAPFDGIIVTAAPDHVPAPLVEQLREGGRLVIPVGRVEQNLLAIVRTARGLEEVERLPVRFVPMTGEAQGPPL